VELKFIHSGAGNPPLSLVLPRLEELLEVAPPPSLMDAKKTGSRSSRSIGGRVRTTIVDARRNGRLDERRAEQRRGEDHQVVFRFLLFIDVCFAVR